jgi:AAA+ ATPase superfamily predicted ATPase
MRPYKPKPLRHFIGRLAERARLTAISERESATILVVYGRRRVGKTELIEQCFAGRNLLKFEGIEGKDERFQKAAFLRQLAEYSQKPELALIEPSISWLQIFELLGKHTTKGAWTIYLEELQWLAEYKPDLIAELKPVWDNILRHNPQIILIMCGSAPSFFLSHVVRSNALHNRSMEVLHLKPLPIADCREFLGERSLEDTFNTYLTLGGIPEYLKIQARYSSNYLGLCAESFSEDSFFFQEFDKIFVSSFGKTLLYREIVESIAALPWTTRDAILAAIGSSSSGGISQRLADLEQCGFIQKSLPPQAGPSSKGARYEVSDPYIAYYYRHIATQRSAILRRRPGASAAKLLPLTAYYQTLGYAFERFCRLHADVIASRLGFSAVEYSVGPYFKRRAKNSQIAGAQIDLIFQRKDRVWTVVEVKYQNEPINRGIVQEVAKKLELLTIPRNVTLQKVLITASDPTDSLIREPFFDRILRLEDLID